MQLRAFPSKLKRSQVYRAIIIYSITAWLLLEGADIKFPKLEFAVESMTSVLIWVFSFFRSLHI